MNARNKLKTIVEWHLKTVKNPDLSTHCHALVVGPSGSGKTHTIQQALRNTGVATYTVNATSITGEAWAGMSLSRALLNQAPDIETLETAIIVIDEIDKIANCESGKDQWVQSVQASLLPWLDRGILTVEKPNTRTGETVTIDTRRMTFILAGAFEANKEPEPKPTIGFGESEVVKKEVNEFNVFKKYGLMTELVNRISVVIELPAYTDQELENILDNFADMQYAEFVLGFKLLKKDVIAKMKEIDPNSGARGLQKAIYSLSLKQEEEKLVQEVDRPRA